MRITFAILFAVVAGFGVMAGALYFLLQGDTYKGSALHGQLEAGLERIFGPEFDVELPSANLAFDFGGLVSLKSSDIKITRRKTGKTLSTIGNLVVGVELIPTLTGNLRFDSILIEEATLDADVLGSGRQVFLPAHLDKPMAVLGKEFARFQSKLDDGEFDRLKIRNSRITGSVLGRKEEDPIEIERLEIYPNTKNGFALDAQLGTLNSIVDLTSNYHPTENAGRAFDFSATGINLGEWLQDPDAKKGMVASNANVKVLGSIPFNAENLPLEPRISISAGKSDLRLGLRERVKVESLNLNFRLILAKNQIELDPSEIEIGRLKAVLIGGLKPVEPEVGYAGPLRYDMIMRQGVFAPTIAGEPVVPAAIKAKGVYDSQKQILTFEDAFLTTKSGLIRGSGSFGFEGETPSVKATAKSEGISVAAVKQFWPMFIGNGARKWVHSHVAGGWIKSGTLHADIPPGILFRMGQGARMKPEHFKLETKIEKIALQPFGELPPIREGIGRVSIHGMQIFAELDSGEVLDADGARAEVKAANFRMIDFAAAQKRGETTVALDGDLATIAAILEARPLRTMERMKVRSDQFKGKAHADIVAKFPIGPGVKYEQVDWNVLLDLQNASSSRKLSGRIITEADVLIDANPKGASVRGSASIDGVKSQITLVEPIGKTSDVKQSRTIVSTLQQEDRKKLGIDLNPVVVGPIQVKIVQTDSNETHEIDFTEAEVALPWIGWRKGVGIPARGRFELRQKSDRNYLDNFTIEGAGFYAVGDLAFDKRGLISAKMSKIILNEGDDFRVSVNRSKNTYEIDATGDSFDGRGLVNKLIHEGGFADEQGERSVNLKASFEKVIGFEERTVDNATLTYESRGGWLSKIDLLATGPNESSFLVQARRSGNTTRFNILTSDAGHGLAFSNIYSRMAGGNLTANLNRVDSGPFVGPVSITSFDVINEPRLEKLVTTTNREVGADRRQTAIQVQDDGDKVVKFLIADAEIEKGVGYLSVNDGIVRSATIGLSYAGQIYDAKDRINLRGTFMPANPLDIAVSVIPLLGQLFSNGKDNALIGIKYQLKGPRKNPILQLNPVSAVTPGVFNKVFELEK